MHPNRNSPAVNGAESQQHQAGAEAILAANHGYSTATERILDKLDKVKPAKVNGWLARCPAHDDGNPSLSVTKVKGRALVNCFAGCKPESIVNALGMTMPDLFDSQREMTYTYDNGRAAHRSYKSDGSKVFRQSNTDRAPELYKLAKVREAVEAGRDVYIVEGEEDVRALESLGVVATTSPMGASNWAKVDYSPLIGVSDVYVVQDLDDPGRARGAGLAAHLRKIGAKLGGVLSPKMGNDAADHVAAGFGLGDFVPVDLKPVTSERQREPGMQIRALADLPTPPVPTWLARGFVPRNEITVLVGDEGIGKSLAWVMLASRVTTGKALPAFHLPAREPGDVVLIITEDSAGEVMARLTAAGADLARVHLFSESEDGSGTPVFPESMPVLYEWATENQITPALVVVDAWLDTVATGLNVRDTQQGRIALAPWKEAATRLGTSVILVTHTNRMDTANTRDLLGATVALRQKARMILFAARHPDDGHDGTSHVWIGPDKSNTTGIANAVRFEVLVHQARTQSDDDPGTVATLGKPTDAGSSIRHLLSEWRIEQRQAEKKQNETALSDLSGDILALVRQHPEGITAADVAEQLREEIGKVRTYLGRLTTSQRVQRVARGCYAPGDTPVSIAQDVSSVSNVSSDDTDDTQNTLTHAVTAVSSATCTIHRTPTLDGLCGRCAAGVAA